jgi:hypothetical protein
MTGSGKTGPFRCVNMVIKIVSGLTTYTVGVVEGLDIDLSYAGGTEPVYGSRTRKHSAGSKIAKVTLTRWYYADEGQEDLLLDLFDAETIFTLSGELVDEDGTPITHTTITITGCRLYRWRPKTGGADDIMGEEAYGEGTGWTKDFEPSTP